MQIAILFITLATAFTSAQATTLPSSLLAGTGYASYSAPHPTTTQANATVIASPTPAYSCIALPPSSYSTHYASGNHTVSTTSPHSGPVGGTQSISQYNENWGKASFSVTSSAPSATAGPNGTYTSGHAIATGGPSAIPICPPGYTHGSNTSASVSVPVSTAAFSGDGTANATSTSISNPSSGADALSQNLTGDDPNSTGSAVASMKVSLSVVALGGFVAVASML